MNEDEAYALGECENLLNSAKEVIAGIYIFKDLVSWIDISLDEVRDLERKEVEQC